MATDVVTIPEETGLERHGIERVSPTTRTHVRIRDNFTMWLSANLMITTFALGVIAIPVFGLGFWDSLVAILLFNAFGVLPVAFFSTLGPKLGLRQMTISRFSFGWVGAIIMALFNVVACVGWSAINVIVGGQLVADLSNNAVPQWIGILIIAILTTLVSIYGYRYVHRYERYAWMPMAIIFTIMFFVAAPHFHAVPGPAFGVAEVAGFISFGAGVYAYATGWSPYAADYNVNQPESTSPIRVFLLTFLGVFIPCVLLETLGLAFATITVPAVNSPSGGDLLAQVAKPLGGFGTALLVLLALSVIANNIPNDYSLGLSMQVLGKAFQRVNRAIWTLIGAVVYILIAIPTAAHFNTTLSSFLLLIAYWLAPWGIILILEHFIFRRGKYNIDDWNTRRRLPVGWAAMMSMAIGLIGAFLGFAQTLTLSDHLQLGFIPGIDVTLTSCEGGTCDWAVTGLVGGLVNPPMGVDVGFELGAFLAGITYLILRRIELNSSKRGELEAGS
jgi:NCS1 nucleoside transporter family